MLTEHTDPQGSKVYKGAKFGRLTAECISGIAADGHKIWQCICECGEKCNRSSNNLNSRTKSSCGCALPDIRNKHGMRKSPEWSAWNSAKMRCTSKNNKDFAKYGGRGIAICDRWANSFENFYADMGSRPNGSSLDRIDVNGGYSPENCRWATASEQARNRRRSVVIEWRGIKTHLCDIAKELGITYGAAFNRFKRGTLHDPAV